MVAASTDCASYGHAARQLKSLAEVQIGSKRCERITQTIGRERVAAREQRREAYEQLPLPETKVVPADAPEQPWENRVAAVMVDGGRLQLRDERWGQERTPGEPKSRWWREPKIALVATFASSASLSDPHPEPPTVLLDPLWLVPKLNEIKAAKGGESAAEEVKSTTDSSIDEPAKHPPPWSPPPLVRSVVATLEPYVHLGKLAKVEAYHRGFTAASRKAFVADGLASNWTIHGTQFSEYTPITDLMHALTYVYQAAKHLAPDMEACWLLCLTWIRLVWQGQVLNVVDLIDAGLAQFDSTTAEESREKIKEARNYLSANASRMRYADYRRTGLPITTALMESTVKQINRRMKGTEKFWRDGAEPQLQLCAEALSETEPLKKYWQDRQSTRTGRRKSRTTA